MIMAEPNEAAEQQPAVTVETSAAAKPAEQQSAEPKKAAAAKPAKRQPAVTTETTAALHGTPAPESTDAPRPFLSEGVRSDLEIWGQATDPATGGVFKRDKSTGTVTFTDRAGEVTEVR